MASAADQKWPLPARSVQLISDFPTWDPAGQTAIDFTIVHPLQPSADLREASSIVQRAEDDKVKHYSALCEKAKVLFVPWGMNTWTGYGPRGAAFLRRLLKDLVGERHGSDEASLRSSIHQRLSFAVQRQVAQQLLVMLSLPANPAPPASSSAPGYPSNMQEAARTLSDTRDQRVADVLLLPQGV